MTTTVFRALLLSLPYFVVAALSVAAVNEKPRTVDVELGPCVPVAPRSAAHRAHDEAQRNAAHCREATHENLEGANPHSSRFSSDHDANPGVTDDAAEEYPSHRFIRTEFLPKQKSDWRRFDRAALTRPPMTPW